MTTEIEDITCKYFCNSVTEEERKTLLSWLEEKEDNRAKFREMYDMWLYSNALLTGDEELEAALRRFKGRISRQEAKGKSVRSISSSVLRVAVSVLLLFSAAYVGYLIRGHQTIAINRLLTGVDGKGKFVLPDGSTVWLNANSVLEYPESFTGGNRVVTLEGEALFEVKEDIRKPFFVKAGGLQVEVLGTRFLVNNYSVKPVVETMLVSGSVKIGGDYFLSPLLLRPGELITYNKQTAESDIIMVNTDDYTNWIHSKLTFDKTNLANVIVNLEKWYGVEIVASRELENIHLTFTIRREPLEEVLKYMSVTSGITHTWKNDILYLSLKK